MVAPIPWIHLHDLFLDGCVHTMIHVSQISVMYMYLCLLAGFLMAAFGSMHLLINHFTPHSCSDFMLYGASVTQHFVTIYVLPVPRSSRISTVTLICFPAMKNMSPHPSSSTKHFPLTSFPKNLPSNTIFKTDASAHFFPCIDLQSLKLGLEPNNASEPFITHTDPLLASF